VGLLMEWDQDWPSDAAETRMIGSPATRRSFVAARSTGFDSPNLAKSNGSRASSHLILLY
jgi:hypothetical protein